MKVIMKSLDSIKPYERNPRKNNEAVQMVANSIKEFGWKQPIVIDAAGVIVAEHTRFKAAKKLEIHEVPCIVADDLTPEQIKAYRLADNKVSEKSEWDESLLKFELSDIFNIDMQDFGFDSLGIGEDGPPDIEKVELKPYRKVHYLISADINENDRILKIIEQLNRIEGVEIESTLN